MAIPEKKKKKVTLQLQREVGAAVVKGQCRPSSFATEEMAESPQETERQDTNQKLDSYSGHSTNNLTTWH